MKTIWKYNLIQGHEAKTNINIPLNSKLLSVGKQGNALNIWFEVDKEVRELETRKFYVMHTGGNYDYDSLQFIQTVVFSSTYVLHVFEEKREKFLNDDDMRL